METMEIELHQIQAAMSELRSLLQAEQQSRTQLEVTVQKLAEQVNQLQAMVSKR
jgi:septal ring factor EnvC (AmiA/AmiB activator)